ncbi:MAG: hypothetical protein Q4P33_06105 [Flaviflexus sp.]|nr:hypothetical protein [Flaviflexus sp.]
MAAVTAAFIGLVPVAFAQPAAGHLDISWVSAPSTIAAGEDLVARIDWDRNDAHGEVDEVTEDSYVLELAIDAGLVEQLPASCANGSAIGAGGRSLTCVLDLADDDGVMGSLDVPIRAWGGPGEEVVATVSDGMSVVATSPIPLTAEAGVDVAINPRALPRSEYAFEEGVSASVLLPLMIAAPAGGMPLTGTTMIDLEFITESGPDVLAGADISVVGVAGDKRITGIARTTRSYPAPEVAVEQLDATTLRLKVAMPEGVVPPRRDGAGHLLDVLPQASFGLRMTYPLYDPDLDNGASTWRARIRRVEAHAGTRVLTSQIRTHNDEAVTSIVDTGRSSARFLNGPAPAAGGLIAQPGHEGKLPRVVTEIWQPELGDLSAGADGWSGTGPVLPGDQLIGLVTTARYSGRAASSFTPGTRHGMCLLFDKSAPFTGRTSVIGLEGGSIEYRTGPGSLADTDCGDGQWVSEMPPPDTVGAVRLLFDPSTEPGVLPDRIGFAAGYRASETLAEGEYAWMSGMASIDTADHWYDSDTHVATTKGEYGTTTTFRDAVRVQQSRTSVALMASPSVLEPGQRASLRATTLVSAAPFADRHTARVRHELTLPRGFAYVPGSGPNCEIDESGRVLTWTDEVTVGEPTSYDIAVVHESGAGTATGKIVVHNEEATALNVDSATARLAVTEAAGMQLTMTTAAPTFALDGANRWTVRLANHASHSVALTDTVDILPWSGDNRGTLTSASPVITDLAAPAGTEVWVSQAPPEQISVDPADPGNGSVGTPSSRWQRWTGQDRVTAVRWISRDVPAGASLDYTVDYTAPGATNGDRLVNSAQSRSARATTMINSMSTTLIGEPSRLQVDKELVSVSEDRAEFSVTVRAAGPGTARHVLVADLPRAGLADIRFTNPTTGEVSPDGTSWMIAELGEGQEAHATVSATVNGTSLENLIVARQCTEEPCEIQAPEQCVSNVDAASDTDQCDLVTASYAGLLQIDKELLGPLPEPGGQARFTLTVRNGAEPGPWTTVRDITVHDLPGAGIVPGSVGADSIEEGQWHLDELAAGEQATVTVLARVDDSPQIVNAAWVESPLLPRTLDDPAAAHPNASVVDDDDQADVVRISRRARLAIDKRLIAMDGDDLTYRIEIGNLGGEPATGVTVTDQPGANLDGATFATPERGSVEGLTWRVGTLEPGQRAAIEVTGLALADRVVNGAHVDAPGMRHRGMAGNDGLAADDDQGDTETTILPPVDLRLDKRIVPSKGRLGFEVEVCNLGGSPAREVTLTDEPSDALADVVIEGEHATTRDSEGRISLTLGTLRPGTCETVVSSARVTGSGTNIAYVTSPDDPLADNAAQVNDGIEADTDGWDEVSIGVELARTGPSDVLVAVLSAISIALGILALLLRRGD